MPRPRKPTAQKKLEGTERKSRANPNEPKYEPKVPEAPACLEGEALAEYRRVGAKLHSQRVLADTDRAVLTLYSDTWAEWTEVKRLMDEGRRFLVEEPGQPKKYPLSKEKRELAQRLQSLAGELGLSPASRGKVSSIKGGEEKPAERLRRQASERLRARRDAGEERDSVH